MCIYFVHAVFELHTICSLLSGPPQCALTKLHFVYFVYFVYVLPWSNYNRCSICCAFVVYFCVFAVFALFVVHSLCICCLFCAFFSSSCTQSTKQVSTVSLDQSVNAIKVIQWLLRVIHVALMNNLHWTSAGVRIAYQQQTCYGFLHKYVLSAGSIYT